MTDQFKVQTDDGQIYVICEFTNFIEVSPNHEQSNKVIPGLKRLSTIDGMAVNFRGNELYEIVGLGVTARKVNIEEQP